MAGRWAVHPPLLLVCGATGMRLLEAMGPRDLAVRDLRIELARLTLLSCGVVLALAWTAQSIHVLGAGFESCWPRWPGACASCSWAP